VRSWVKDYRRDRLEGQAQHVELWVEAAGMVPQAERVAHYYGIAVYSAGGFDSTTIKQGVAQRVLERERPTLILHVGDHDPSGLSIFDAAAADVAALVRDMGGSEQVEFRRIAITPAQIARYALPEAAPKKNDKRGDWRGGTVQAEALAPDILARELDGAIQDVIDLDALHRLLAIEEAERDELIAQVGVR
jgi:hypothetical protein